MKRLGFAITTFTAVAAACCANIYRETHYFKQKHVTFSSNKLPAGSSFTILQISDLHNHVFGADNERLIHTVETSGADIIVLTGDLIDKKTKNLKPIFSFISQITAHNPNVLFVSGNHEWANSRTGEFFHGLHERNVTILDNSNMQFTKNATALNIAGIADLSTAHEDLHQAFHHITDEHYTILLSHSPDITETCHTIPADLILSGHTHGGQVRFPFIGAFVAPGQGFFPKRTKGTYPIGPNQYLYIDSGLGTTRLPMRFLNQSQLSLITIVGK
ncbi:metallophosphoesterase [Lentibacillus sp. N15]|uniref:metallophosphoesterase n=1 Tax=Lentibacillus songyuanensis TaxID=3136161 RepID=UPI0031BAE488